MWSGRVTLRRHACPNGQYHISEWCVRYDHNAHTGYDVAYDRQNSSRWKWNRQKQQWSTRNRILKWGLPMNASLSSLSNSWHTVMTPSVCPSGEPFSWPSHTVDSSLLSRASKASGRACPGITGSMQSETILSVKVPVHLLFDKQ